MVRFRLHVFNFIIIIIIYYYYYYYYYYYCYYYYRHISQVMATTPKTSCKEWCMIEQCRTERIIQHVTRKPSVSSVNILLFSTCQSHVPDHRTKHCQLR